MFGNRLASLDLFSARGSTFVATDDALVSTACASNYRSYGHTQSYSPNTSRNGDGAGRAYCVEACSMGQRPAAFPIAAHTQAAGNGRVQKWADTVDDRRDEETSAGEAGFWGAGAPIKLGSWTVPSSTFCPAIEDRESARPPHSTSPLLQSAVPPTRAIKVRALSTDSNAGPPGSELQLHGLV